MLTRPRLVRTIGLTAAVYGLLALLAIELTLRTGGIALAWAANGVLVAVLATLRPRHWVPVLAACFVASFAATYTVRLNAIAATGFAIANVIEGAVVAGSLRRLGLHRSVLDSANSVLMFALIAGLVAPAVTAPIAGATVFLAFGQSAALSTAMFDWVLAHGLGNLVVGPLAYMVVHREFANGRRRPETRDFARFTAMIAGVGGITTLVFAQDQLPLLFLPALPMMIATVWLGRPGGALALLAIAVPGAVLTVSGHGPVNLMETSAAFRLQFFQLYLATLFLMALPTAALLSRQRLLTAALRERETALRLLADHSSDVLLSLDLDGGIRFASPSVRALGGYDPDALIGRNALELIEPEHRDRVERAHCDALADPDASFTVEHQGRRHDGSNA